MQNILVDVIERIYDGSMVEFELERIMTAWYMSESGVRQGCPICLHYCLTYMSEN